MSRDPLKPVSKPLPPTSLSRRFTRALVGFGVGIAVGCAPMLGAVDIPLFSSLLSLFPFTLRPALLPLGGFVVGLVAAGTQFYSGLPVSIPKLKRGARISLMTSIAMLTLLLVCYFLLVRQVHFRDNFAISVVTGLTRSPVCPCPKTITDAMCLKTLSANPDNIELCWGRIQVRLSELALSMIYLLLLGSFAFFISLILLQENNSKSIKKRIRS